jgi:CBS domain-containing protein
MKKTKNGELRALDAKLKKIKASDIMTSKVVTIRRTKDIYDAAKIMLKKRISGIPVVSPSGKVQGIITETDLFMVMNMVRSGKIIPGKQTGKIIPEVGFAMSVDFKTVSENTSLDKIIVLMKYRNQHTVPVTRKGRMVGIIGKRDVFKNFYSAVRSCQKSK